MTRTLLITLAVATLIGAAALASQTIEGQVVKADNWVLTVRTQAGETVTLSPKWVQEGSSWQPARPARTILPALEAGEMVRVSWSVDEKEHRNRIETIEVISPLSGTLKGTVVRSAANELVVKPIEKPGTVTLNTKFVQVEGKWVPDPQISRVIQTLKAGDKVTVEWAWDQEGRKRIIAVSDIVKAPREPERERR